MDQLTYNNVKWKRFCGKRNVNNSKNRSISKESDVVYLSLKEHRVLRISSAQSDIEFGQVLFPVGSIEGIE